MPNTNHLRLSDFLPYRLSVLSNTISRQIADFYGDKYGMSVWQWRVMAILGEFGNITATEVGVRTAMDKVAVSRASNALISMGYVARTPVAGDARQFDLSLTPLGLNVYQDITPVALNFENNLTKNLSAEDLSQFNNLLSRLAENASPHRPLW